MSFLAFLLQINYFICTFKRYVFIEYTEYVLLQRWHSETVTLALLSCQKLKNRFCRYHSSGVVNKLPQSLVTEEYVHGRKSEFEMKMFLKFGSYLITHLPVCSVCVEAPWPEARKGKELSAFISWWRERTVSSAYPSDSQFSADRSSWGKGAIYSHLFVRVEVKHGHRDGLMYIYFLYRAFAVKR